MKTITTYTTEDYDEQREQVYKMSNKELSDCVRYVARGYLPDYNYTGSEEDFEAHKRQMIMGRVAAILEVLNNN